MFANLTWSSGLIADGTGSELARAVGHPDVFSAKYVICHMPMPYSIVHFPYSIYLRRQYRHDAQVCCATKATVERRCYGRITKTVK